MKKVIALLVVLSLIPVTSCTKEASPEKSSDANKEVKAQPAAKAEEAKQEVKEHPAAKTAGLIGWWKLNEKDGNSVADSSGNNFNGEVVLNDGPSVWAAGQGPDGSNCAKFTGTQIIEIPDGVWDKVKDKLSIAFWANQDPCTPSGETWPGPFGSAPAEGLNYPDPGWLPLRAFLPSPNGTVDIGNDEEHIYWQPDDTNATSGAWNHYVFVKDANERTLMLYHNGEQVASNYDAMEPMPKIKGFILGGRTGPTADWSGKIADFRVYNIVLNDQDAMKLFEKK